MTENTKRKTDLANQEKEPISPEIPVNLTKEIEQSSEI